MFTETHLVDDASALYHPLSTNDDQVNFLQNIPVIKNETSGWKQLRSRLFNPTWCFFTQWLHPGLRSLEHWVPSELLPSAAWVRKDRRIKSDSMSACPRRKQTRTQFISSVHSPGWVWLRLCHVDREPFFLRCSFFQHPEDNSGVRVGQDFLWREHFLNFI